MRTFLASPFTRYLIEQEDGSHRLDPGLKTLLLRLENELTSRGHEVFMAHRVEEFGSRLRAPHVCTPFDMLEMRRADVVIAIPDQSFGVHVELGWATAMGKPVIVLVESGAETTSPLVTGLDALHNVRIIETPAGLMSDADAQAEGCDRVLTALARPRPRHPERRALSFVSTAFGFGPVSKAVTVARAIRTRDPNVDLHYFGDDIDRDFASAAEVFDRVWRVGVDDPEQLRALIPHLSSYEAVVSVLNLDLVRLWPADAPPLYLIDSLAWMWQEIPPGIERVRRYFVQDYLVQGDRVREWRERAAIELVAPVDAAANGTRDGHVVAPRQTDLLLVNFAGCASPLSTDAHYVDYAQTLTDVIVGQAADEFGSVVIACNARLAGRLRANLRLPPNVSIDYYPPDEFLALLTSARRVLSAPGITTTIEAIRLEAPIRFLLPQNYSQALISERYRGLLGDAATMALSRFGREFEVEPNLPESEGMRRTIESLRRILSTGRSQIDEAVGEILRSNDLCVTDTLRRQRLTEWDFPGQDLIAAHVLEEMGSDGPAA